MFNLCAPALIYLIFSITQILIDTLKGLYNTAFMKALVTAMITILLNILCERGLNVVSWIIVFIPFILMTVIVSMLLYIFGLDVATGSLNYKYGGKQEKCGDGISVDRSGNIIIYDPEYSPGANPVYYKLPNIIVPNPHSNDPKQAQASNVQPVQPGSPPIPNGTSSPAYQS
jgi:hypothetical protein